MPPASALGGIPTVLGAPSETEASEALPQPGGVDTPGSSVSTTGGSVAALMANLLPQANSGLASGSQGVYVGEGLPPVPTKLAAKIRRGEFVEMTELLPEFWSSPREDDHSKLEAKSRRARSVQDIFTWLQCYGLFVSVLGSQHPSRIPELMAYQATIVRASQDYAGLAWVRYDSAFRRQAALTGLTRWSAINPTLYTLCFAGSARTSSRCELCFATTHHTKECAQQGDPDPGVRERLRAIEKAVLSMSPVSGSPAAPLPRGGGPVRASSGQACRLWNNNRCTFRLCRHAHVCLSCGGGHPVTACPGAGPQPVQPNRAPVINPKHPPGGAARPY